MLGFKKRHARIYASMLILAMATPMYVQHRSDMFRWWIIAFAFFWVALLFYGSFQTRHPRIYASLLILAIATLVYVSDYFGFKTTPEDRRFMLKWWVIALHAMGLVSLVGIGVLVCVVLDAARKRKPSAGVAESLVERAPDLRSEAGHPPS